MNPPSESEYARELRHLEAYDFEVRLILGPTEIVALIGNLQLALRHPANVGATSEIVREIKDKLIARVGERYPLMADFLRCGDNPAFDA